MTRRLTVLLCLTLCLVPAPRHREDVLRRVLDWFARHDRD
jgi:hypothetical protein